MDIDNSLETGGKYARYVWLKLTENSIFQ